MTSHPLLRPARSIGEAPFGVYEQARKTDAQHGLVVGEFRFGHYVRFGDTIFAIGETQLHPGPLHVVFIGPKPHLDDGADITIDDEAIRCGRLEINISRAVPWRPHHPALIGHVASLEILHEICGPVDQPAGIDTDWPAVKRAAAMGDLGRMAKLLAGRGEGLTPTGDDILAGMMVLWSILRPNDERPIQVAATAPTTDLSRGFLRWAARGHSIGPVHHLLRYAAAGDETRARHTAAIIQTIGSSSGNALLSGLGLGAGHFSLHAVAEPTGHST